MCETPRQKFANTSRIRDIKPSPWQVVSKSLTQALLALGHKFGNGLLEESQNALHHFLEIITTSLENGATFEDQALFFPLLFSVQGFFQALTLEISIAPYPFIQKVMIKMEEHFNTDLLLRIETAVAKYSTFLSNDEQPVTSGTQLEHLQLVDSVWKHYVEVYFHTNQQLGALQLSSYLCEFVRAVVSKLIQTDKQPADSLIDKLLETEKLGDLTEQQADILRMSTAFALNQISSLDDGADYIELASPERIDLAYFMKASALQIIGVSVYYKLLDSDKAVKFVVSSMQHDYGMSNPRLAVTVFKLASLLCVSNDEIGGIMVKYFSHFITLPTVNDTLVRECATSLVFGLKTFSQDVVVSTIYTLINVLSVDQDSSVYPLRVKNDQSSISESEDNVSESYKVGLYRNAITAVVAIAAAYGDPQIASLACTVLNQKLNVAPALDREVTLGMCDLATHVSEKEFRTIWKALSYIFSASFTSSEKGSNNILEALCKLSSNLTPGHRLYESYLVELLQAIVNRGDVHELEHHRPHTEISATASEIALFLPPLALLLPGLQEKPYETTDTEINTLFRNAWFNMVVHGFSRNSEVTVKYRSELEIIARSTPPLVSEVSSNKIESELELNTVLQRGSSHHNVNNQKEIMEAITSSNSFDFRGIQYPKLMFLSATVLLETLRASTGNCSKALLYFGDPGLRSGDTRRSMSYIVMDVVKTYVSNVIKNSSPLFSIGNVAAQLKEMIVLCCHRVRSIQTIGYESCDALVSAIPSALCQKVSLFALLDVLTLLWSSCLDAEMDEYEPRTIFEAKNSGIRLELSDSYDHRRESLNHLLKKAREWVKLALETMNNDVKNILTAYLNDMSSSRPLNDVALGFTFALEMGGTVSGSDRELAAISKFSNISTDTSSGFLSQFVWNREARVIPTMHPNKEALALYNKGAVDIHEKLKALLANVSGQHHTGSHVPFSEARGLIFKASAFFTHRTEGRNITRLCVQIPFKYFSEASIQFGITMWLWAINENADLKPFILSEVAQLWEWSVNERVGMYTRRHDLTSASNAKMEYAPSNKAEINHDATLASREFSCHQQLIRFLSSAFKSSIYSSRHLLRMVTRLVVVGLEGLAHASFHPLAKTARFELIQFGCEILEVHIRVSTSYHVNSLKDLIVTAALGWFKHRSQWPFGGNKLKLTADVQLISKVALVLRGMYVPSNSAGAQLSAKRDLLLFFLNDELAKMTAWLDPLQTGPNYRDGMGRKIAPSGSVTPSTLNTAWGVDPALAVYLVERYGSNELVLGLQQLTGSDPIKVVHVPEALEYFLRSSTTIAKTKSGASLRYNLLYWAPISPIESINLFLPVYHADSLLLQYAMRSLESHDVNITFFYVPQLVQSLRHDFSGYIERYILETAQISQLFAHQIIWNILANLFKGEDLPENGVEDAINPTLERVKARLEASFTGEALSFYNREFSFFSEVTSISAKLGPFIKKTKAEKKAKIDEEIAKIKVDVGVYLPSNPDGVVADIDRKSGKPLQSHAKAPFLATFKIQKEVRKLTSVEEEDEAIDSSQQMTTVEGWQSAIFKVGDDCRQDVLALQIISVFRSIFNAYGLDLYVFPYRVTATAPGCGVIDVLPNSISRDMLGREAVNGLYEYFTSKHGGEDSIQFQLARNNFVKSLAAYSVISYLIQFKDRHNGNIMYDDQGHILHIDFGFCFDIVPGGVRFEAAPFKLTHEMIAVMGGSTQTQAYRWFEELCVKAFLACRPHSETIIQVVLPMLDSGLPCFKGELTIKRLRSRFVLEKTEREAAIHFRSLIKKSYASIYTKGYDEFQRITNGIPY